ncbi:AAA family ATPase [Acanthopleuribacter pedis]|uniref:AAA family ATPase n=1 Tax=Acanthopleuribacter pedis TaxID=442870 RepID=A0A8J7U594_9BACT|nr:AAA family ATPase [Acanthopleuribacter pedis]MBO1320609.1 AAA family ATPase [Acanthopleuribacter pedis]
MIDLDGFHIEECLHEGVNFLVYRGTRLADDQPVVCKVLRDAHPNQGQVAAFRAEFERSRDIDFDGVPRTYEFLHIRDLWVLVQEDFGGTSLAKLKLAGNLSIQVFLEMAIRLTDILAEIHRKFLVHKDINPLNVCMNPETKALKIIDFGIASELSRENTSYRDPEFLEGTLPYMSPEQTGRMNRAVDYRSDFYSLGVTFYELLTGFPPFRGQDPLELIHCHLAMEPLPPTRGDATIPEMVSKIILKLLAKEAESRYQSAYGLKDDLTKCLEQWRRTQSVVPFELGENDQSDRFQIPQKVYGREEEVVGLIEAFERTAAGGEEVMMISGYSGIGKSTLVREIHRPITARRGFFLSGKFDQLKRDVPYAALFPPFRDLVRQVLAYQETKRDHWRNKIKKALGANAGLLMSAVPELVPLLGRFPTPDALPPHEAENRFQMVVRNFIRVFANAETPLVLFLDDLHWADGATLELLRSLLDEPDTGGLFLIGAYRAEEVDGAHALTKIIEEWRKSEVPVHELFLKPLKEADIAQEVADTLNQDLTEVGPLARLIHDKTGGNPFFVTQFLNSLYVKEMIHFDHQRRRWSWDLQAVKNLDITDNLIHLLVENLGNLPEETLTSLKIAACIGDRFDLSTLAPVIGKTPRILGVALWKALLDGFLIPLDAAYRSVSAEVEGGEGGVSVSYRFVHDRIRQAAYSLLPESERDRVHLTVGREFLAHRYDEEDLFEIVNHLNRGANLMEESDERIRLAELNLAAARKAKLSIAWEPAYHYLRQALFLLESTVSEPGQIWENHYDLTQDIHLHAAELACLLGDYGYQEQLTREVTARARDLRVKVWIQEGVMNAHYARGNYFRCFETGQQVLDLLGIELPGDPTPEYLEAALLHTARLMGEHDLNEIGNMPPSEDELALVSIRILNNLIGVTWKIKNHLFPLVVSRLVEQCLRHGNAPSSPFIFANYGVVNCLMGDLKSGVALGELAVRMLPRYPSPELKAKTTMMTYFCLMHWKQPLQQIFPKFIEGYQAGMEAGDLEWASYSLANYCLLLETGGGNLNHVAREHERYANAVERLRQKPAIGWFEIVRQSVLNLIGDELDDPCLLQGEVYDELERLHHHEAIHDNGALFAFHRIKAMMLYQFGRHTEAMTHVEALEKVWQVGEGTAFEPVMYFYAALVRLADAMDEPAGPVREEKMVPVLRYREKMLSRAAYNRRHFKARLALLDAELARMEQKPKRARDFYDEAIDAARAADQLDEATLGCELAGRFFLGLDNRRLARYYLEDARDNCIEWGNRAKLRDLETRYPHVLSRRQQGLDRPQVGGVGTIRHDRSTLEYASVLKASQAISGEIKLDRLSGRMISILIENAGAQRGTLLLKRGDTWYVTVEGTLGDGGVTVVSVEIPLDHYSEIPLSVINYLISTGEVVILDDGPSDLFSSDPFFNAFGSRSVLAMPVRKQNHLNAVIFLEHRSSAGLFTNDRLEILQLLASQTAISVENAQLYGNLESLVEERTRLLNKKTADLMSSVRYAQRIQQALLPSQSQLRQTFKDFVLFFKPRDVVSGDFYWHHEVDGRHFIAVSDCTGHGVPGALMSMIGHTLLNRIVAELGIYDPADVLERLNTGVREALSRESDSGNINDGMEVCFIVVNKDGGDLTFAGAGRPLFIARAQEKRWNLQRVKGSRRPIGGRQRTGGSGYENVHVQVHPGDMLYLTTDGFSDQNNAANEKYGNRRFSGLLEALAEKSAEAQQDMLQYEFAEFTGSQAQRDDVTIMGFRF